jgi:DMSO/TMAO reductase YedYZ molybdopterin-dependent catalytic subunit
MAITQTSRPTNHSILVNVLQLPTGHDAERTAFQRLDPEGFSIRHPPKPHELNDMITNDSKLFQTIHMGAAVVDPDKWLLVIDGLVENPCSLNLTTLKALPARTITSFHECFGSPLKPATTALWRIGNIQWTGVPLRSLLELARPLPEARYVWSEGLDRGTFAGVTADRYQKDLPLSKALSDEVLIAYAINGQPLSKERGGPVRLVVPGWFGTNSTKWLSKISLQRDRATGPYTARFYNIPDPGGPEGAMKPVWKVDVNSMICRPAPGIELRGPEVRVEGWAWSHDGIKRVEVTVDDVEHCCEAMVDGRTEFSWQRFSVELRFAAGQHTAIARATSTDGETQPLSGRRNHCHSVKFTVLGRDGGGNFRRAIESTCT